MKIKYSLLLLATVLVTAGLATADNIPADSNVGDRGSAATALHSHKATVLDASLKRNSSMRTFREGEVVRGANDEVQILSVMEKDSNPRTGETLCFEADSVEHKESIAEFGSKHGNPLGWNDDGGEKHGDRGWDHADARESVVASPEPGTKTLLLVGMLFLTVTIFRQHATRNAIQGYREGIRAPSKRRRMLTSFGHDAGWYQQASGTILFPLKLIPSP